MLGFAADRNFRVLLGIFLRVKPRSHHNTTQVSARRRAMSHICRVIKLMLRHVAATQRIRCELSLIKSREVGLERDHYVIATSFVPETRHRSAQMWHLLVE